jgi:hypothetical protein
MKSSASYNTDSGLVLFYIQSEQRARKVLLRKELKMKGISLTLFLTTLLAFAVGCGESSKRVYSSDDNEIVRKNSTGTTGKPTGLFKGTVMLGWDAITLGYDKKYQSGRMKKGLTYQQAQAAGFVKSMSSFGNGYYGGSHFSQGPGSYRERGYDYGFGYGYGYGYGHRYGYGHGYGHGFRHRHRHR